MLVLIRLQPVCDNTHQRTGICAFMNNTFLILGGLKGFRGSCCSPVLITWVSKLTLTTHKHSLSVETFQNDEESKYITAVDTNKHKKPQSFEFPLNFFTAFFWNPHKVEHFRSQPSKAKLAVGLKEVCPTGKVSFVLWCLQGTTVYPLLASVLFDESEWEQPHTFYPAHFLDQEGKFVRRDAFLPFSAGL